MIDPLIQVRVAGRGDVMDLLDIDIKSFEEAWTTEEWQSMVGENRVRVATKWNTVIGFLAFQVAGSNVEVNKVAVRAAHRRRGASRLLLADLMSDGSFVRITIPESYVYPGPHSRTEWLTKIGFKPVTPFIKNKFTLYGEPEDGVRFVFDMRKP